MVEYMIAGGGALGRGSPRAMRAEPELGAGAWVAAGCDVGGRAAAAMCTAAVASPMIEIRIQRIRGQLRAMGTEPESIIWD